MEILGHRESTLEGRIPESFPIKGLVFSLRASPYVGLDKLLLLPIAAIRCEVFRAAAYPLEIVRNRRGSGVHRLMRENSIPRSISRARVITVENFTFGRKSTLLAELIPRRNVIQESLLRSSAPDIH